MMNGEPYWFLRRKASIDCLNERESLVDRLEDYGDIMRVLRYRFFRERLSDPMIFAIDQSRWDVYCTKGVETIIRDHRLRGFAFAPLDGHGRDIF